ncbi:MAG: mycothione reductase [Streptosporangiaceae bacterium]
MRHYDLVVLGAGSGNMLFTPELAHLNAAIVEQGRFGGTCLNRGCIPSKMFVVAADAAVGVETAARLGVHATLDHVDWKAVRDRVMGRIGPLPEKAVRYRRDGGIDVYTEPARFVAPKVIEVGSERISADTFVVATGSRPVVPAIDGLAGVTFYTSDTIMQIDDVPKSLVIIGGGFIAAEFGHVFGAFGSAITIVQRASRLLMTEDEQISQRFTELAAQRHRVLLDTLTLSVESRPGGVAVNVAGDAGAGPRQTVEAAALLVATGRRPNTDLLDAEAGGLELDEHGHIVADSAYRTSVPGVWAFGDAANHFQLKHMANAEARVVRHNLVHPDDLHSLPNKLVPHAVFSDPQIASVGLTEQHARERGIDYVVSVRNYADVAYGWALEDTTGFVKLLADPVTRLLLGAHMIGPQAATLVQPLLQAMTFGQTVDQIGRGVIYIHPALTEVVEQALLAF